MIDNGVLRVGGNSIKVWIGEKIENFGKFFQEWGNRIIISNKPKIVTNPSAKLFNPFTLVLSFTVDTNQKYQVVLQGDYKEKYKECEDGQVNLTETEMFMIINSRREIWFKKE